MSVATTERLRWDTAHEHFAAHVKTMPRWHKAVLVMGVVLALAGGAGWVMGRNEGDGKAARVTTTGSPAPVGSSKFIDDNGAGSSPTSTTGQSAPGMISRLSPNATRIGVSVLAGFVLGWLFRAFLKTMAFFLMLAIAILAALSYFGVLNVDFTSAREHYASALHWLGDQTTRLKDLVISHLPSSGGGALGAFLGFRRR
jgi:uncharacterized membrane protein (Fun14 family)